MLLTHQPSEGRIVLAVQERLIIWIFFKGMHVWGVFTKGFEISAIQWAGTEKKRGDENIED